MIAGVNTNILNHAAIYLNQKKYGIGKNESDLLNEIKKMILTRAIIKYCPDEISNDIKIFLEKYK